MKTAKAVLQALKPLFPDCGVSLYRTGNTYVANINSPPGSAVVLRFADMPKIAEAFGTEHLNFESIAGQDHVDSVTFDGTLLNIYARYDE